MKEEPPVSHFDEWKRKTGEDAEPAAREAYIKRYYAEEREAYDRILSAYPEKLEGTSEELSSRLGFTEGPVFAGFLDGVNPSLSTPVDLEALEGSTRILLDIDFDALFWNMLEAKATWLHQLPAWDGVIDPSKREETVRRFRASKMATSEKVGRNDPCPCGSGRKYKVCCGKS
jgi:hypothetical protein